MAAHGGDGEQFLSAGDFMATEQLVQQQLSIGGRGLSGRGRLVAGANGNEVTFVGGADLTLSPLRHLRNFGEQVLQLGLVQVFLQHLGGGRTATLAPIDHHSFRLRIDLAGASTAAEALAVHLAVPEQLTDDGLFFPPATVATIHHPPLTPTSLTAGGSAAQVHGGGGGCGGGQLISPHYLVTTGKAPLYDESVTF